MKPLGHPRPASAVAFTLLEIMTVIVVILILLTMVIPIASSLKRRAERTACTGNLRSLHQAANAYVQDQGSWPQISTADLRTPVYADNWIQVLSRYQVTRQNWICPTIQRIAKNPDYLSPEHHRVDYFATPFDANRLTPFRWNTQPWFIERADMHGSGNLLIFPDGSVEDLQSVRLRQKTAE